MSQTSDSDVEYPTLPPEKLLEGNIRQIEAGLQCIDDIPSLQKYMAFENKHENRTPIQEAIRLRADEIRRGKDTGSESTRGG